MTSPVTVPPAPTSSTVCLCRSCCLELSLTMLYFISRLVFHLCWSISLRHKWHSGCHVWGCKQYQSPPYKLWHTKPRLNYNLQQLPFCTIPSLWINWTFLRLWARHGCSWQDLFITLQASTFLFTLWWQVFQRASGSVTGLLILRPGTRKMSPLLILISNTIQKANLDCRSKKYSVSWLKELQIHI